MQQCDKHKTINDTDHPKRVESKLPGSVSGYCSSEATDSLP